MTGRPDGTGLGLAVAQEILMRHGGLIEFESDPGRTVFTLLLPLESEARGAERAGGDERAAPAREVET